MQRLGILFSILISIGILSYALFVGYSSSRSLEEIPVGPLPSGFEYQADEILRIAVEKGLVLLPLPRVISEMRVEEAILLRRSIRDFTDDPIRLDHLSMILWSAYGVTETTFGLRAVPSAGGTYPLEIYVVVGEKGVIVGNNTYIPPGVYKYKSFKHILTIVRTGDLRAELSTAALGQEWVREAPVSVVICAVYERTVTRYGVRGRERYVPMEVGHSGQNIYLMATALDYGAVVVGAFYDDQVKSIIRAAPDETPMYIVPIGIPRIPHYTTFEEINEYILKQRGIL